MDLNHLLQNLAEKERVVLARIMEKETGLKIDRDELAKLQEDRHAVEKTLELLDEQPPALALNGTNRFASRSLMAATLDFLSEAPAAGLTRSEIMRGLIDNGYNFGGDEKNFYSSVYVTLKRLVGKSSVKVWRDEQHHPRFVATARKISSEITGAENGKERAHHS